MRNTSATWKSIVETGNFNLNVKATINGKEYTEITAPKISRTLISGDLTVGGCCSGSLRFSVLTSDDIAERAKVVISAQLTDGTNTSEWMDFGTFFIRSRQQNPISNKIEIEAYDAMQDLDFILASVIQEQDWPLQMHDVAEIAALMLGTNGLDSRSVIMVGPEYEFQYDDSLTVSKAMQIIGELNGGNWMITADNYLRLVTLVPITSRVLPATGLSDGNNGAICDENNAVIIFQDELIVGVDGVDSTDIAAITGSVKTGQDVVVSGVSMTDTAGNEYFSGDKKTGRVIRITGNPFASQEKCDVVYALVGGLRYRPVNATKTVCDPAIELGDIIIAGNVANSVAYRENITLGQTYRADIEAPQISEATTEKSAKGPQASRIEDLEYRMDTLQQDVTNIQNGGGVSSSDGPNGEGAGSEQYEFTLDMGKLTRVAGGANGLPWKWRKTGSLRSETTQAITKALWNLGLTVIGSYGDLELRSQALPPLPPFPDSASFSLSVTDAKIHNQGSNPYTRLTFETKEVRFIANPNINGALNTSARGRTDLVYTVLQDYEDSDSQVYLASIETTGLFYYNSNQFMLEATWSSGAATDEYKTWVGTVEEYKNMSLIDDHTIYYILGND